MIRHTTGRDNLRNTGRFDFEEEELEELESLGRYDFEETEFPEFSGEDRNGKADARRSVDKLPRKASRYTEILKYGVLVLILGYIVVLMIFTSGSTKSFEQIEKSVESALDTENLKKADVQGLKRYYGLNGADYEGVMLYTSVASMSTEEVLLIKVKDESQMQRVKEAVQKRLENRKNDFDGYAPEQVKLIEQAQLTVRGKFIFLAVAPKAESYKDVFAKSL